MTLDPQTRAAIKQFGPTVNHLARARYGISGQQLLARTIVGESGDRMSAVSRAGARGDAQFMPGSRAIAMRKYGIDPWRSPGEAVHAMALHLRGRINGSKGLEGYNPGDSSYPAYILGQKVKLKGSGGMSTITGAGGSARVRYTGGTAGTTKTDTTGAIVDALLSHRAHGGLLKAVMANLDSGQYTTDTPGKLGNIVMTRGGSASAPATSSGGHHIANFEGKPVAAWMVPGLQYARAHGWKGTITSGVRTRAQQAALYANRGHNPYPVAAPGHSNHEIENGGAVDVSDYTTLASIMQHYPGEKLVQGTAIGDPVHFSRTGH